MRTSKGGHVFCYPEHIDAQIKGLFDRLRQGPFLGDAQASDFIKEAASFLAELNAIHPFREGNGRAQLALMHALSIRAGHAFDMAKLRAEPFLAAMIRSFDGELAPLERELRRLC